MNVHTLAPAVPLLVRMCVCGPRASVHACCHCGGWPLQRQRHQSLEQRCHQCQRMACCPSQPGGYQAVMHPSLPSLELPCSQLQPCHRHGHSRVTCRPACMPPPALPSGDGHVALPALCCSPQTTRGCRCYIQRLILIPAPPLALLLPLEARQGTRPRHRQRPAQSALPTRWDSGGPRHHPQPAAQRARAAWS